VLISLQSVAQLPQVKVSVDKNNILIGQQINYHVETSMPDNTFRLNWFSIPDSLGTFVVVSKNKIDSSTSNGNLIFSQDITLTNFDSGRQVIPSLKSIVSPLDNDSTFNFYTDSIPINVSYSPLDSIEPFHDIKTIIEVQNAWPWWVWGIIILGALLLIALIIFLVKRFKKKKDTTSLFTSNLSPFDEAMESLSVLEKENLLVNNKVKEFHTRLSDIFKRYLSRLTNTNKLYLTTDEILIELPDYNLSKNDIANFANCLRMGNAVKFAQYIPPTFENEKCFSEIKNIITIINNQPKKTESDL
jgi:hypothetical protein